MDDVLQHMDVVLPGYGTVPLHVSSTCIPPRTPGRCHLVHCPQLAFCVCLFSAFWQTGWLVKLEHQECARQLAQEDGSHFDHIGIFHILLLDATFMLDDTLIQTRQ